MQQTLKAMCHIPDKNSGFTLIELMITVSIVAILAMVAAPSFQDILRTTRLVSLTNELVGALNLARSEAIKRGQPVTVCKSADPGAANPVCSTTATWQTGWLIFVDNGTAGTFDNLTDTRLKVGQLPNTNAVITPTSTFTNYLSYLSTGVSKGSGVANGSLNICIENKQRSIVISATGRIRIEKSETCS